MFANSVVWSSRGLTWSIATAAAGAIAGALLAAHGVTFGEWLHWLCKPLTTILIFVLAWRMRNPVSPRYRHGVLAGIVCSLGGDVFLMLPQDLFVAGLLAFLCAHLCLLVAWLGDSRWMARPWVLLTAYGYGALNLYLLWDAIEAPLRVPVIIYVVVLATAA
ncbi:MAG: lysoplasmalogenase, partial [Rhodanobacter sp.]